MNLKLIPVMLISLGLMALPFVGCATLKKEECVTADWYEIGYEDGSRGLAPERIADHRKACAKHGVVPDYEAYRQGRDLGLVNYCTPFQGYQLGLRGLSYKDICPGPLEQAFKEGFHQGREIHGLERQISATEKEIKTLETRIRELDEEIKDQESRLSKACKDKDRCSIALKRIRILDREHRELTDRLRNKEAQVASMERTLEEMKAAPPY